MKIILTAFAIIVCATGFAGASAVPQLDETAVNSAKDNSLQQEVRRKKRIPGGSGCDDPGDVAEHPECRRG